MGRRAARIESFEFQPGRRLLGKYEIESFLGGGWEGEVYKVVETRTGIPRALKVFFPHRNIRDRAVTFYAKKLERLRGCPMVVQYHHMENFWTSGVLVTALISDYVGGELLLDFLGRRRGKRLPAFEALHLVHALASGLEPIHDQREYHGDIHDENVLVWRRGVRFEVRLLDFFQRGRPDRTKIAEDVIQVIRLFYDALGGQVHYAAQPAEVKTICCGLRRDLIQRKFPTAHHLRAHLETFEWGSTTG